MTLLTFLLRTYRWSVLTVLLISLVSGTINTALIGLINQQFSPNASLSTRFIGWFAMLVLLTIVLDLLAKNLLSSLTGRTSYHLRMNLACQILALPLVQLEALGTPRLLAILSDDVRSIANLLGSLPGLCIGVATVIGALVYLGWLSPLALTALALLALPTILGYRVIQHKARTFVQQNLNERDNIFDLYRTLVEGQKELKLHALRRQAFLQKVLEPTFARFMATGMAARRWQHMASTLSQSIYFVFVIAIFALSRWQEMPLEVMASYALVVLYLKSSILSVLNAMPTWSDASIAIQRIENDGFSLFTARDGAYIAPESKSSAKTPASAIAITLNAVVYDYQHEQEDRGFTLGPISLSLHAGELIFVRGGNGSGKTTLIKLLAGLYMPDSGTIYWNNVPVCTQNLEAYRQNFTAIFAEPFLFEQLLGLEQIELDQQAQGYLARLQLNHKVRVMDGHLSTLHLSHGQRKRLALLTAWLEDRPVYIFDEWAAGQDPEFREVFYRQVLPQLKARGKLVLVISHDENYFSLADRWIQLDFGKIVS